MIRPALGLVAWALLLAGIGYALTALAAVPPAVAVRAWAVAESGLIAAAAVRRWGGPRMRPYEAAPLWRRRRAATFEVPGDLQEVVRAVDMARWGADHEGALSRLLRLVAITRLREVRGIDSEADGGAALAALGFEGAGLLRHPEPGERLDPERLLRLVEQLEGL